MKSKALYQLRRLPVLKSSPWNRVAVFEEDIWLVCRMQQSESHLSNTEYESLAVEIARENSSAFDPSLSALFRQSYQETDWVELDVIIAFCSTIGKISFNDLLVKDI